MVEVVVGSTVVVVVESSTTALVVVVGSTVGPGGELSASAAPTPVTRAAAMTHAATRCFLITESVGGGRRELNGPGVPPSAP